MNFEELVAVACKTRILLGGLLSTSWDLPWRFLLEVRFGLSRISVVSWISWDLVELLFHFVFGPNPEGLIVGHIACKQLFINKEFLLVSNLAFVLHFYCVYAMWLFVGC